MTRTYTFAECYKLLNVDPKTFGRWLEKASIDPKQQVSKVDNRIRYLTQEQLEQLANDHGRTLTPPDVQASTTESVPPGAYKLLQERLDSVEHKLNEALDDISSTRTEIYTSTPSRSELQDALDLLGKAMERITSLEEQITQLQAPKRATKAKSTPDASDVLPEGLIPWRTFADLHKMSQTTTGRYIDQGIIHAVRGRWKVASGYVKEAFDSQGKHDFWVQFHNKEGFTSCDDCPHHLEG